MQSIFSRLALLGVFTALALILFIPSLPSSVTSKLPGFWINNIPKIVLGLDLQGGMHLVLEVDQEGAIENYSQRLSGTVETLLKDKGVPYINVRSTSSGSVLIGFSGDSVKSDITALMAEEYPFFASPTVEGGKLVFTITEEERSRIKEWATEQALETIRNRIDKFGVAEPHIQRQGKSEIVIQLPGLKDTERALALIGKTAVLQFRLLDEQNDPVAAETGGTPFGSELLYQKETDYQSNVVVNTPMLVKKEVLLTGDVVTDARVMFDSQRNEPYVSIEFDKNGANIFERITGESVGKRLAIILDENIYSAPVIRERISGGSASISGGFSYEEAADLAIILRAGALPAPVNIVQNVTVGPSLGHDSIEAGINAIKIGGILVLIFMILYYKVSGIIANIAVSLNIIMLLGAMAYLNATLTLPGIAGILLTIGMGVDSNVLIFERIREELRAGRTPRSAIDAGYERAWWTIVDAHVTTLITALVLFQFGSGPIKGFAVTLSLGIIINLFTALVGTKVSFDIMSEKFRIKKVSI